MAPLVADLLMTIGQNTGSKVMAAEVVRGCGYRKVGGLYLVGGGLSAPCDRMPYELPRCPTCGAGVKFTRSHTWLQPDFFRVHAVSHCKDESPCPICRTPYPDHEFGPHLLLWIGRAHYSPQSYLNESRLLGVSRRIAAIPKGLVLGETWVLLAHLDAIPPKDPDQCTVCGFTERLHLPGCPPEVCSSFQAPRPTPGIFCAFIPRAVELVLKESDATPERIEKEERRGVSVVTVPDNDKDHQGSVWDKDEDSGQEELEGISS
jgi:hypothetical protein